MLKSAIDDVPFTGPGTPVLTSDLHRSLVTVEQTGLRNVSPLSRSVRQRKFPEVGKSKWRHWFNVCKTSTLRLRRRSYISDYYVDCV